MAQQSAPPIVDFSLYSLEKEDCEVNSKDLETLGKNIVNGLASHYAIYMVNHGIPASTERELDCTAREFFEKPIDVKLQYLRPKPNDVFGYAAPETEGIYPKRPRDYKETFNFLFNPAKPQRWPDAAVPGLKPAVTEFTKTASKLLMRFYEALAVGLGLEDKNYFKPAHNFLGEDNGSVLRTVHYMPIPDERKLIPGQIRVGEHSDFGTVTFIFQDSVGGLEVLNKEGTWVPVNPIKGAIVVIGGTMLQRYTNDKIHAAEHRVMIPEDATKRSQPRYSHIFFSLPDDHKVVTPCNGDEPTYEPVDYLAYSVNKYYEIFK